MVKRMKKIKIAIHDDTLTFSFKRVNDDLSKKLLNTNVISNDEVIFSDDYIKENVKIVSSFIKELANERKIKKLVINSNEMAEYILDVVSKLPYVEYVYFKENANLTFRICEKLTTYKNIQAINCYSIPNFMLEMLDRAGIIAESRCEILFTSDFMAENNLTSYSKLFYKMNLRIKTPLSPKDLDDFEAFCKINKYLKHIHMDHCDMEAIDQIATILYQNRMKNVKIFIHDNIHEEKVVEALRKVNRRYSSKYKISLKLSYDEDYIKDNYLKQVIFTTIKVCSFLIFAIIGSVLGYIVINNRASEKNVKLINEQINTILSTVSDTSTDGSDGSQNYLKNLLVVNSDTVGWLTVKNTNIDYPVVQANDNSYYLNRNYNKEKDYNGWVFMDYRNETTTLDKNTIIYAHNRYYSGVMFGTLNNVTKKKWRNEEENLYITYNTLEENLQWKIFSVYSIKVTSDYLVKDFASDNEWYDFITMLKQRSDYDFDTVVTKDDKILTLSTCLENDNRLVVHAVLVK